MKMLFLNRLRPLTGINLVPDRKVFSNHMVTSLIQSEDFCGWSRLAGPDESI